MRLRQFPDRGTFCQSFERHTVVPLCREILADLDTPVTVLKKIYSGTGPAFLFESVEGGERWGRYSFLGVSARAHIRVFNTDIVIEGGGTSETIPHHGRPLPVLRDFMRRYIPVVGPELPRFWGGLVGYLTYEMVSFFEAIPNRLPDDTPLAHFILPDEMLIFDNIRNSLMMVLMAFKEEQTTPEDSYENAIRRIDSLESRIAAGLSDQPEKSNRSYSLAPLMPAEAFRNNVETIKNYITQGDVIQTVISQPFVCDPPADTLSLYRAQRYINPSPYLFYLNLDDITLVGSSPETMVRLENQVATLRPIAGTRPRGTNEQADRVYADELLSDEKERAEHLMLVDLGRNDLGRVAETGTVQVTDLMVVERYSHVMHLVSNITCHLESGLDAWDLMAASFPAGTLSGAPKVRAMEIIAELETVPRGPYGGAVGYISFNGNMDLAITIRTAFIKNGRLTVNAGAGIVYDSDPERERLETMNKAKAIQKALAMLGQQQEKGGANDCHD
ncbi:MAG: anthranilate synthase component I family protein [Desulfobacteraceae bacterium]|nr:anthranilate synthase component I family protein [Desulfobacteraceae bacterium]